MALVPNSPVYAPFIEFINELGLVYVSNTTLTVKAGSASDSTVTNKIVLAADALINAAANGLNGLDIGTFAASTMYAVYAIGDSTDKHPSGALLSLASNAQPYLPYGYDMFRRIGYVLTDGSVHILAFRQVGNNNEANRMMWYDASFSVLSGGTSSTFVAQSLAACVPAEATHVVFRASITANAAADAISLRPTGSSSSAGYAALSSAVAMVAQIGQLVCPCDAAASIDYKVSASATGALLVSAYLDQL